MSATEKQNAGKQRPLVDTEQPKQPNVDMDASCMLGNSSNSQESNWNSLGAGWLLLSLLVLGWLLCASWLDFTRGTSHSASETVGIPNGATGPFVFRLDVNYATAGQLQALPDIGEQLARRIVDYRETQGPFTSVDDLLEIHGFGPKTLSRLEPMLTVNQTDVRAIKPKESARTAAID